MPEELQKAKIIVLGENNKEVSSIPVLFNPKEYKISYSSSYKDTKIAGTELFITQFTNVEPAELSLSLFFDTGEVLVWKENEGESIQTAASDVTEKTKEFIHLLYVDASLHRPPYVTFQWGCVNFTGIVKSASAEYSMFEKDGMPTRSQVNLSIREVMDVSRGSRNKPYESPDRTKYRMVTAGKNLWDLAYEEYGHMAMWKRIAAANQIHDPLHVKEGTMLKIPAV